MSLDQEIAEYPVQHDPAAAQGGVDPFAIVAGLIVSILLASLLLWINGGSQINGGNQHYGLDIPSKIATAQ